MHFIQLLTVNFSSDALVTSEKDVMDNANGRPSDNHHNQFMQVLKSVWVLCHDQAIELTIYHYYRGFIFHHKSLFDQKTDHSSTAETTVNTLQNVELWLSPSLCGIHLSVFFNLANFLDDLILLKC